MPFTIHLKVTFATALSALLIACTDSFKDERDEQSYNFVQIGNIYWMAENLNFETAESYCPEGDNRNCKTYGRLYTWKAAKNACPNGWRLPASEDFMALGVTPSNTSNNAGAALKSTSGWFKKGNGTNELGFDALPAGYMAETGKFNGIGGYAHIWALTEDPEEPTFAQYILLDFSSEAALISAFSKTDARSVRCVKNAD